MVKEEISMAKRFENVFRVFSPQKLKEFIAYVEIWFDGWSEFQLDKVVTMDDKSAADKSLYLSSVAQTLIEFANAFSDDLRKIKEN